ncbi:MAG TPA: intradiol ring-cleavage dioxygenase [Acidimicrobiales bacterium]|nr:intradiol ring-cleavage dioxygenase [Acidimicrobiales bacterium]
MTETASERALSRRQALTWLTTAGLAAVGVACSSNGSSSSATTVAGAAPSCVLAPEMTEGPYYISGEAVRGDITEGKPGVPLQLNLTVVDASTCRPIPDAVVEIWHADASGDYSGFGNGASSRTFLRGAQNANADGLVTFKTIYPGWYQGRATHIHLKARVNGTTHTTQLFFNEADNNAVYSQSAYAGHQGTRTMNSQDGIYSGGGSKTIVPLTASGAGYAGSLSLGVQA